MKKKIKLFHLVGLLLICTNTFSQSIENQFNKYLSDNDLKNTTLGFEMIDLNSGESIYSYQAHQTMMTASTMKLITTATALEIFGKDYTYKTKLLLDGKINNGTLIGNIIIRGEGDPALGSQEFLKHYGDVVQAWTAAIQALGITKIEGQIIGDDSYFEGISLVGSTAVKDIGNYYGAGAHALSGYDNTYIIYFQSPNQADEQVNITKTIPVDILDIVSLTNEVKSSIINKDNAYIYGIPESNFQVAKGTIPMNKKSFKVKGAIPDPAKLWALQLTKALNRLNIEISGSPASYLGNQKHPNYHPETLQIIHTISSPPLADIIEYTNRKSINSYANTLVKNIGKKVSNQGNYEAGIAAIQSHWQNKGIDIQGWFQEDGSGLSRANAITPSQLAQVIATLSKSNRDILKKGLKDFGKSGGRILTKSGYMNRVRSFAGYMTLKDGREVAFAVIANNYSCSPSSMRKKMETFLLGI